jgi:hypothetical protein
MIKAKVIKIQTLPDKEEKNMYIKSGDIFHGSFNTWPEIGKSFQLWNDWTIELRTTQVTEIISDREFRTLNSIYKIVTQEDERDERIKIILK